MLQGPPGAADPEQRAALLALGLPAPETAAAGEVDVWAENWPAVRLFRAMQTQLRWSFAGAEGFDYSALPAVEQRLGIKRKAAREAFWGLQLMEVELIAWHHRG